MTTKDHLWEAGKSGNPSGRPTKEKVGSKPISTLRKTLNKLKELEERSLENIAAIVNGTQVKSEEELQEVDKQMLETSKWVIATISSMSRAATQDEQLRHEIRARAEDKYEREQEKATGTNGAAPAGNVISGRFTTKMSETKNDDLEED